MTQRHAPATERNREPILEVLATHLPPEGAVLEISSGTGQHAAHFAPALAPREWFPTELEPENLVSIAAWRERYPSANLHPPQRLDVSAPYWWSEPRSSGQPITAIVNINMIHIAPWHCCEGLLQGAEHILATGGVLYLYGPFKRGGRHTAPSNAAFDSHLKNQDPTWGVRNLESVIELADHHNFNHLTTVEMPANNLSVLFSRR